MRLLESGLVAGIVSPETAAECELDKPIVREENAGSSLLNAPTGVP
jgi:hypothetical protein